MSTVGAAGRGDGAEMTGLRARSVEVIAPSGAHLSLDEFDRAWVWFERQGVRLSTSVSREGWQRFSAPDDDRLAAIHRAARRTDIDAVMITRGGYGLSRLIDRIDWDLVAASVARGCRWIGYSDFTVFHLALLARTGAISWAGPSFCADFGALGAPDAYTLAQFETVLGEGRTPHIEWQPSDPVAPDLDVEGVLWGGNLSMLCSVAGSAWCPVIQDGLLFIEDVNEHPYRIERMLHQLDALGVLRGQAALIVGDCSGARIVDHDNGYDLNEVVRYWRRRIDVPIITGLPFGHIRAKAMLGVGLRYRLRTAEGSSSLVPAAPA